MQACIRASVYNHRTCNFIVCPCVMTPTGEGTEDPNFPSAGTPTPPQPLAAISTVFSSPERCINGEPPSTWAFDSGLLHPAPFSGDSSQSWRVSIVHSFLLLSLQPGMDASQLFSQAPPEGHLEVPSTLLLQIKLPFSVLFQKITRSCQTPMQLTQEARCV